MVWFGNQIGAGGAAPVVYEDFEGYTDTADFRSQWSTNDAPMDWGIGTSGPGLHEGSQYLEATDLGGGADDAWTLPTDGILDTYPTDGSYIGWYLTPVVDVVSKNKIFLWFGMESTSSSYYLRVSWDDEEIQFSKEGSPLLGTAGDFSATGSTVDDTYLVVVDYHASASDHLEADLYAPGDGYTSSIANTSITDGTITGGGLRFQGDWDGAAANGTHVDYVHDPTTV